MWWSVLACRHEVSPPTARPAPVAAAALERFLEGTVAIEAGDPEGAARAAQWMLLLDRSAWTALHAAELLAAAHAPVEPAVDALLAGVGALPPCEAREVLDLAASVSTDPRLAEARASGGCP